MFGALEPDTGVFVGAFIGEDVGPFVTGIDTGTLIGAVTGDNNGVVVTTVIVGPTTGSGATVGPSMLDGAIRGALFGTAVGARSG